MSANNGWETLDVETLLTRRDEAMGGGGGGVPGATVSANAGGYAVPLGRPLRRTFPTVTPGYTKLDHPYLPDTENNDSGDADYEWAKRMMK